MSRGGPASVILRPVAPAILPPPSVRTPPALLPVSRKIHFVLVAVAVALLPVVVMAIAPLRGPPVVQGLVVLVMPYLPEAVVRLEGAGTLSVARVKVGGRERRVGRVVHGVWRVVAHGLGGHGGRNGRVW